MIDVSLGWSLAEVAEAVSGDLVGDGSVVINAVATDTRSTLLGNLFVALRGESFDGHVFAPEAIDAGSVGVVVERSTQVVVKPRIEVESTGDALAALAVKRRNELEIPVVAVTGSTGKTSTKDMLSAAIEGSWASPRSFNNEIGVPLTVLATPADATALIVEVGSRGRGHIDWLAPMVKPDVAIVTNLGVVHLETFGSRTGLADAKYELVDALGPDGVAVLPSGEALLEREPRPRTISFGTTDADVVVDSIQLDHSGRPRFSIRTEHVYRDVSLPLAGVHQAMNAAAAVAAGVALGLDVDAFIDRLESVAPSPWRMEVSEGSYTVVNDTYNANPQSVRSALETVDSMDGRKIAILGVMSELGHVCEKEHTRIGELLGELEFAEVVVVGPDHGYALGFPNQVRKATDIEDAADTLADIIEPGDVVLVKASRSASLERLAHQLTEDAKP